jgi:hypothetical protein
MRVLFPNLAKLLEEMRVVPSLTPSLNPATTMTACSWQAGWRSLLLAGYKHGHQ